MGVINGCDKGVGTTYIELCPPAYSLLPRSYSSLYYYYHYYYYYYY